MCEMHIRKHILLIKTLNIFEMFWNSYLRLLLVINVQEEHLKYVSFSYDMTIYNILNIIVKQKSYESEVTQACSYWEDMVELELDYPTY